MHYYGLSKREQVLFSSSQICLIGGFHCFNSRAGIIVKFYHQFKFYQFKFYQFYILSILSRREEYSKIIYLENQLLNPTSCISCQQLLLAIIVAQDLSPYQNVLIQHHLFSRTKASDFRFSLKTHYNLLEGSNIDEMIDGI